jgi:ribosomal protein L37E
MKGLRKDDSGDVYMFDTLLGNVKTPSIADLWEKANAPVSRPKKADMSPIDIVKTQCKVFHVIVNKDETVCPRCGSDKFHWRFSENGIDAGYCLECRADLYRKDSRVFTQVGHVCGYPRVAKV